MSRSWLSGSTVCLVTLAALMGCEGHGPSADAPTQLPDHNHGHSHAASGPHGGHIVELDHDRYHAEWVHDDESGELTVYILDGAMQEVGIAADHLLIDVVIGTQRRQHALDAVERESDGGGSFRFSIVDKTLIEALKLAGTGVEATLTVELEGTPYTADLSHSH